MINQRVLNRALSTIFATTLGAVVGEVLLWFGGAPTWLVIILSAAWTAHVAYDMATRDCPEAAG